MKPINLDKSQLESLREQGKTRIEIAKILNCGVATVDNYIRKYNLPMKPMGAKKYEFTEQDKEDIERWKKMRIPE